MGFKSVEDMIRVNQEYKNKLSDFPEEWKDLNIDNIAEGYKISNHGKIMSKYNKIMKTHFNKGYEYIKLCINDNKRKDFQVHRLVAKIFIKIPDNHINTGYTYDSLQVNHINGIPHCNASFNLEWCTPKENTLHAHKIGLAWKLHGENNNNSVITESDAHTICKYLEEGRSNEYIKNNINVSDATIHAIRCGENWKSVSSQYKFAQRINSFSDEVIHDICKDIALGEMSGNEIARKYGASGAYIQQLRKGEFRSDITSQYDFSNYIIKEQISDNIIRNVCKDIEDGLSVPSISSKYNLSKTYIHDIKHHRKKVDISKDFNF